MCRQFIKADKKGKFRYKAAKMPWVANFLETPATYSFGPHFLMHQSGAILAPTWRTSGASDFVWV